MDTIRRDALITFLDTFSLFDKSILNDTPDDELLELCKLALVNIDD